MKTVAAMMLALLAFCATPALAKGKTEAVDPTKKTILALDWKRGPTPQPLTARATGGEGDLGPPPGDQSG
jgi:hypothetical protein